MQKYCYSTYLTVPDIKDNTCGFADFLRGCCALLNFCKIYKYKLMINNQSHNLFKFFKYREDVMAVTELNLLIIRSPTSYDIIDKKLDNLFISNESFNVFTNALYKNNIAITNLDEDIKEYMKYILTPNKLLEQYFIDITERIGLNVKKSYIVIHFRIGDCIVNGRLNNKNIIKLIIKNINEIILENTDEQILFLSNSKIVREQIKELVPDILYSITDPIHLGVYEEDEKKIGETLSDFVILTKCKMIYSFGYSGFSYIISKIYDINYKLIKVMGNNFIYNNIKEDFIYNHIIDQPLVSILRRKICK